MKMNPRAACGHLETLMYRVYVDYIISRGHFSYSFGEDGSDTAEDAHTIEFAEVDALTPTEALELALAALPAALETLLSEVDSEEAPVYRDAVSGFLGGDWKPDTLGFEKEISFDSTRWAVRVSKLDASDPFFGEHPVDMEDEPETAAALLGRLAEAA